jgi:hypothetical protein
LFALLFLNTLDTSDPSGYDATAQAIRIRSDTATSFLMSRSRICQKDIGHPFFRRTSLSQPISSVNRQLPDRDHQKTSHCQQGFFGFCIPEQ